MSDGRSMSGIRAVVLDLDDTLYLERAYVRSGFAFVAGVLGERFGVPFDLAGRLWTLSQGEHRRRAFDQLLVEMGVEPTPGLVQELVGLYRGHVPRIQLLPDAERALARWAGRFALGLITDGDAVQQWAKIDALGLRTRFGRIIVTGDWGAEWFKPHPRAFEEMALALSAAGRECVYIGDNPSKDFVTPRRLGWRTVQVRRAEGVYLDAQPAGDGAAEGVVNSLDEIVLTV